MVLSLILNAAFFILHMKIWRTFEGKQIISKPQAPQLAELEFDIRLIPWSKFYTTYNCYENSPITYVTNEDIIVKRGDTFFHWWLAWKGS